MSVDLTKGKHIDFSGKALDKWEKVAKLPLPQRIRAYHEAHREMAAGSNKSVPPITNMMADLLETLVVFGHVLSLIDIDGLDELLEKAKAEANQ